MGRSTTRKAKAEGELQALLASVRADKQERVIEEDGKPVAAIISHRRSADAKGRAPAAR